MNPHHPPTRPPEGSRELEEELDAVWERLPEATILDPEGSREVEEELGFDLSRLHEPTILNPEGTREVLMELKYGSPLTPQRKAMLDRVRAHEAVRKRVLAQRKEAARKD